MKILQICLKPPLPEVDGGCKAMHAITQGMLDCGLDVKVLTISTPKHPFLKDKMSKSYLEKTNIEHRFIDTKVSPLGALVNLFSSKSYNLERFYSDEFEALIIETLKGTVYDIVLLETFFVTGYIEIIRQHSDAKIIYQAQNIEHDIWRLNAKKEKGLKKKYINFLASRLKTAEIANIKKVDGIAPITNLDKFRFEELGCTVPMVTIPFGVNLADYKLKEPNVGNKVFHIGSMDWLPNLTGINWLLENVWSGVIKESPDAKLKLAGRHMPESLKSNKASNIEVVGEVSNAVDFINENNIMVVPLLAGSGMRIKIIEGMALGKLIIATTIAAEGVSYTDKENIVIANTPEEFTKAITYYLKHTDMQISIGKSARILMENAYDNRVIVNNLIAFFKQIN
ncbi:MAG: glycosyltransferase family 4 protein [Flavobacteriales bacterium]|nr:glycosyltransferase family 4 protein [Flavobacteriales bacterium]